jgi:serine/threonine protein phosphatase 1
MRYLAIGDIHGCFKALTTLAEYVPFQADDTIVTLGDYVNRGPNSCAVLDWLIDRRKKGKLVALRGNHELIMLQAREGPEEFKQWQSVGGDATLKSYSPFDDPGQLIDIPDAHWDFLENGIVAWSETDTHFFVHANVYPELPLAEQPDYMLYWEQFGNPLPHESGKIMVCGHTSQKSGLPKTIGHAVCIDTWAYGKGWLTCLDVATGKYWQANQGGKTRSAWLDSLGGD